MNLAVRNPALASVLIGLAAFIPALIGHYVVWTVVNVLVGA